MRSSVPADHAAIEALYPLAFPDEDLLPVVRELLKNPLITISLVAELSGEIIGHVAFTDCSQADGSAAALLAPLAVAPDHQRRGIGSALVQAGLAQVKSRGIGLVCVLGDPGYYKRFGFAAEELVTPPYPLPPQWQGAWQSVCREASVHRSAGRLDVPAFWQRRALWSA